LVIVIVIVIILFPRANTFIPPTKAPPSNALSRLWRIWAPQRLQKLAIALPRNNSRIRAQLEARRHNVILQVGTGLIEAKRARLMRNAPTTVAWDVAG